MIFWWGARGEAAQVGAAGRFHCNACGKDGSFTRVVSYRVRHAYWLFRWMTGRQLHLVCDNCGASAMDDMAVGAPEVTRAIPAFDRRGWLAAPALLASLVVIGSIGAAADRAADRGYLARPRVGDIYEVDIARRLGRPEAPVMFTALRVAALRGDQVELEMGNGYYAERRGVDRDIDTGAITRPGYFVGERMMMPKAALAKMYADGVAVDVRRP